MRSWPYYGMVNLWLAVSDGLVSDPAGHWLELRAVDRARVRAGIPTVFA